MRIVLSVEAIKHPLTGIGRYTWELAIRLPHHSDISSVRYLAHGRWRSIQTLSETTSVAGGVAEGTDSVRPFLQRLARSRMAGRLYERLLPVVTRMRINSQETDLYHGTNYFVPDTDVACVVTVHDLSTLLNPEWHQAERVRRINKMIKQSINRARFVITDSQAVRQEIISYFALSGSKVIVVPLGVDPVFRPRKVEEIRQCLAKLELQPGGYCLCVATVEPRKNLLRLINAYRALPARLRDKWPLVLVGEKGWNSESIHQAIVQAEREGWLKYLGYVPQDMLPALYSGCHLFVYPSLYEGFGLPVAEAMASGVPVLTSNRSSLPEVAGDAAWLIDPEDESVIREGLLVTIQDELWRARAVKAGLRQAAQLTWEACVCRTVDVYRAVLYNG